CCTATTRSRTCRSPRALSGEAPCSRTEPCPTSAAERVDRLDGARDPAFGVRLRRQPAALELRIGVLVPVAVRIVVAEHGRRGLRLRYDAERQVELHEPIERLRRLGRGLVVDDDGLEAVDGGEIGVPLLVPAADRHLLAGEMVAREHG